MKEQEKIQLLKKIDKYIKGELSQDEIDDLWKQFLQHPEWYDWFETELHLRSLIKKGKKPNFNNNSTDKEATNSIQSNIKRYRGWIYAAAAAVILAIGLQFFSFDQNEPLPSLAIAEIEQSNLIGADVLRSGESPAVNLDVAINDALATAYDGETEEAIEKFQELLDQSTNDRQQARIEMNLGILYYNSGNFEAATNHFQSVTGIEIVEDYQKEKSWWFLGNALLNLDQPRAAREAIFNAYSMDGRYQSAALSLLKKLDVRLGNIPTEESPEQLGE
jgi:tetratricopeptide (TPR) repeat protein